MHMQVAAKIYGFYNNSCNFEHHAGLPAGKPAMTQAVKVDKMILMNKYFAYHRPSKCFSC